MIPIGIETTVKGFYRIVKESQERHDELVKELSQVDLEISDIEHEADPRVHIVGLPRKRKVTSKEAMVLGLRLKDAVIRRRDIKDELAFLKVLRANFKETPIDNLRKFVDNGKCRKYRRRTTGGDQ